MSATPTSTTQTTPAALAWADRQLNRLANLLAVAGSVAVIGLMALTVVAVFWRYVLNDPIFGVEDLSTLALCVVVAAAVAYGGRHRAHVSVNIIGHFYGRRVTRITDLVARSLSTGIVGLASYALFVKGSCGLPCGAVTNNLSIVQTPFYYTLGIAMLCYALLLLLQLLVGLAHWHGNDPNDIHD